MPWSGYELRRREPLIEIRFFRSAPFSGASTIAVCAFAAQGGFLFLNTLYLQGVRHLSPFHAGLYILPMASMVLVCAPISGRIVSSHGARWPLVISGVALLVSSVMLTVITPTTQSGYLLAAYFLFGIGCGLVNPPITNTAVSGMPASQAGVAAAVASTSRTVGLTLGVAVIGAVYRRRDFGRDRAGLRGRDPRRLVDLRRPWRPVPDPGRADHDPVGGGNRSPDGRAIPRRRAREAINRSAATLLETAAARRSQAELAHR